TTPGRATYGTEVALFVSERPKIRWATRIESDREAPATSYDRSIIEVRFSEESRCSTTDLYMMKLYYSFSPGSVKLFHDHSRNLDFGHSAVSMLTPRAISFSIRRNTVSLHGPHSMRVLHRDPKTGEIKVRVENPDDLWHLHNLLQPGDLVRASTYRREDVKTDKLRPERGEKVRVTLTIRVEDVEFQAFSDRLRISGVIVEGPQDLGRHHTLNVGVEDVLSIIKTWRTHELRRIDEAVAAAQNPLVAFLALDDEEALIAQLRQYGVRELSKIRAPGHGKMFPSRDAPRRKTPRGDRHRPPGGLRSDGGAGGGRCRRDRDPHRERCRRAQPRDRGAHAHGRVGPWDRRPRESSPLGRQEARGARWRR